MINNEVGDGWSQLERYSVFASLVGLGDLHTILAREIGDCCAYESLTMKDWVFPPGLLADFSDKLWPLSGGRKARLFD